VFCVFDLPHVNKENLIALPLDQRRDALSLVLRPGPILWRSESLPGTPEHIEQAVRRLGLEGVVAKKRHSIYEPGRRSRAWLKVRFNRRQELVIGGYKPHGTDFESLLVGYFEGRKLYFAGKVRSGLTPRARVRSFVYSRRSVSSGVPF
jgi:bifunctional non-homologous end joining protein LigD